MINVKNIKILNEFIKIQETYNESFLHKFFILDNFKYKNFVKNIKI